MKRSVRIFGILLLAAVAITACDNEKRDKEDKRESKRMEKMSGKDFRHNKGMGRKSNSYMMRGNRPEMGRMGNIQRRGQMRQGQMGNMQRGMGPMRQGQMGNMQRGMGQGMMGMRQGMPLDSAGMGRMGNRAGRGMGQMNRMDQGMVGPGGIFLENIPNVTEKQRKEFSELLKKQQDEMTKIREQMASEVKSTLKSQREKMLKIFTDEQKKTIGVR
jgi:hypothetical protein